MFKPKSNLNKILIRLFLGLQVIGAIFILSVPLSAMAAKVDLEDTLDFTPQVTIPDSEFQKGTPIPVGSLKDDKIYTDLLPRYIGSFYNYGLAIVGILATIMLMGAGLIWLTSGGDSGKISKAKNLISGSIVGLIILLISWTILNTINPNLVAFKPLKTETVTKISLNPGCCELPSGGSKMMNDKKECENLMGTFIENDSLYNVTATDQGCLKNMVYCIMRFDCNQELQFCYETDINELPLYEINCGTTFKPNFKNVTSMVEGRCSEVRITKKSGAVESCAKKKVNCVGVKDGTPCPKVNRKDDLLGYCYDNLCYEGYGKSSERCGIQPNAFCANSPCKDLSNGPYIEDLTGAGRQCHIVDIVYNKNPMHCCYKEKDYIPDTDQESNVWGESCGNEGGRCYLSEGRSCPKGYNRDLGGKSCNPGICCKANKNK